MCKFCERFKDEIKIDRTKGITVKNLYDVLKLSMETLNNADNLIECWLEDKNGNDVLLGNDFAIGHFNFSPDLTFTFKIESDSE